MNLDRWLMLSAAHAKVIKTWQFDGRRRKRKSEKRRVSLNEMSAVKATNETKKSIFSFIVVSSSSFTNWNHWMINAFLVSHEWASCRCRSSFSFHFWISSWINLILIVIIHFFRISTFYLCERIFRLSSEVKEKKSKMWNCILSADTRTRNGRLSLFALRVTIVFDIFFRVFVGLIVDLANNKLRCCQLNRQNCNYFDCRIMNNP